VPGDSAVFGFDARIFNADRELCLKPTLLLPVHVPNSLRSNLVGIGSQLAQPAGNVIGARKGFS
jgi:hypothetical protein